MLAVLLCVVCPSATLRGKLSILLIMFYTLESLGGKSQPWHPVLMCWLTCSSSISVLPDPQQDNCSAGGFYYLFASVSGVLSKEWCIGRCNT